MCSKFGIVYILANVILRSMSRYSSSSTVPSKRQYNDSNKRQTIPYDETRLVHLRCDKLKLIQISDLVEKKLNIFKDLVQNDFILEIETDDLDHPRQHDARVLVGMA